MSERRNAWGRGPDGAERATPPPSLADDQKTKFDRHAEVIAAQRADTSKHDARVEKLSEQNARWVNKNLHPVAAGGTRLTPSLAKDKAASDASLKTPTALPASVSVESVVETIAALIRDWKANTVNGKNYVALFEQNEWNKTQLSEMTQHLLKEGHPVNAQLPETVFLRCYNGGHLDPRKRTDRAGNTIYMRGEARRPAPVPVPKCVWPDEAAAIQREQEEKTAAAAAAETKRAKSLPFDQLQREAMKDRKYEAPQMGPMVS